MSLRLWIDTYRERWMRSDPCLRAFLIGLLFLGINQGILNSTFNNYLNDTFHLDAQVRGSLEFPRELPGFAIIFVTSVLANLSLATWAVLVGLLSAVGVLGLGLGSPTTTLMVGWMLFWSLADHLLMPIESGLGLALAQKGSPGRRLGQIAGARNLAMIIGGLVVTLSMGAAGLKSYGLLYVCAAATALVAAALFARMRPPSGAASTRKRFVYRRSYHLYYVLNILFGARKQIFLTFGPWVLVTELGVKPQTIALLLLIAAAIGVVFRQYFGLATDRFGERAVLLVDAAVLLVICLGYALSRTTALLFVLYIADNLMFATRIARTTYLDRVATDKSDIAPTLSLGVTLDHAISATVPALGGWLWFRFGYPSVFFAAAALAFANGWAAWRIGPPERARHKAAWASPPQSVEGLE